MAPSSSSSSSSGGSHAAGLAIAATAMALSGTLVLYSLCRAKPPQLVPSDATPSPRPLPRPRLRPCLASSEKRRKKQREMLARRGSPQQKRVRFADDVVVDNKGKDNKDTAAAPRAREEAEPSCAAALRTTTTTTPMRMRMPMPANREALYRGMLRDRSMLRVACSY